MPEPIQLHLPGGSAPVGANGNGFFFKDPAFSDNSKVPVHRWIPWIAGFSAGFVDEAFNAYLPGRKKAVVLDPFAGVGTTLVQAHRAGHQAIGFEINSFAALASRAKTEICHVDTGSLRSTREAFERAMERRQAETAAVPLSQPPRGFRSRVPFFSPRVERQVLFALDFIDQIEDVRIRDLFLLAFGAVMVKFSNYSYEPSLSSREGCGKPNIEDADVGGVISEKLQEMEADIIHTTAELGHSGDWPSVRVVEESFFNAFSTGNLRPASVDLIVTSPPYVNNYHYIRNTRPQLFWLGFVRTPAELKHYELNSFGKFWQTVRDGARIDLLFEHQELADCIGAIRERHAHKGAYGGPGWANYVAEYFNDTYRLCALMSEALADGGVAVVVIGNSIIQGINVPADRFLGEIGELHGLRFEGCHMLRTKRVGNSIVASSVRRAPEEAVGLYEVAVVLRKPPTP